MPKKAIAQFNPRYLNDQAAESLQAVMDQFPREEPVNILLVGSDTRESPAGFWGANITYQLEFPDAWLLVAVNVERVDGDLVVDGITVQPIEASLQEINGFRLGRNVAGYAFLLIASVVPALCIFAFIQCLRTPIPKRKWAWAIFTLLGFGAVTVDWSTGGIAYSALSFQILGSGMAKSGPYAPWMISFSFPLGAIVVLSRRRGWLREARLGAP